MSLDELLHDFKWPVEVRVQEGLSALPVCLFGVYAEPCPHRVELTHRSRAFDVHRCRIRLSSDWTDMNAGAFPRFDSRVGLHHDPLILRPGLAHTGHLTDELIDEAESRGIFHEGSDFRTVHATGYFCIDFQLQGYVTPRHGGQLLDNRLDNLVNFPGRTL